MTQWYVKELSELTDISVQTLHHYDRIGLLKPSIRLENNYRVYSERDLSKLQQIIALKYFGFTLTQIKALLSGEMNLLEHLTAQSVLLNEKVKAMNEANNTLNRVISECEDDESFSWETTLMLIEVYQMINQLGNTWAGKVLSQSEFDDYVKFCQSLPERFTAEEKAASEHEWATLVEEISNHVERGDDPASEDGIDIGQRCMSWVNNLYSDEYAYLRKVVWEKGFKGGHMDDHGLSPKSIAWLDQAIKAYYMDGVMTILNQVGTSDPDTLKQQWAALMQEKFHNNSAMIKQFIESLMSNDQFSLQAQRWLKKL